MCHWFDSPGLKLCLADTLSPGKMSREELFWCGRISLGCPSCCVAGLGFSVTINMQQNFQREPLGLVFFPLFCCGFYWFLPQFCIRHLFVPLKNIVDPGLTVPVGMNQVLKLLLRRHKTGFKKMQFVICSYTGCPGSGKIMSSLNSHNHRNLFHCFKSSSVFEASAQDSGRYFCALSL